MMTTIETVLIALMRIFHITGPCEASRVVESPHPGKIPTPPFHGTYDYSIVSTSQHIRQDCQINMYRYI